MIKDIEILNFCEEINSDFNEVDYLASECKLSDNTYRKFEETFDVDDWDILTDSGFNSIKGVSKTVPYNIWELKTTSHTLKCADTHIIFDECWDEVYVKDLNKDSRPDKIITENGPERVISVNNTNIKENMYDIQLEDNSDNRYYTNGILSHNSIFLANDAVNFVKRGHNTAVISAEMGAHKFVKRIGSNALNISMGEYGDKAKDKNFIKRRLDRMSDGLLPPGQLFIKHVPTSQFSVLDIEAYLKELEEVKGVKMRVIVIDYINILANYRNPNSENTYMKVKQIAEDLRAMAIRNDWLIITATQINRCVTLDTIINEERAGDMEIRYLKEGDKILGNEGYKSIKKIHPVEKQKVYLIKTKSGKTLKVSGNHITPTLNGDKKTTELSIGDSIYIKNELQ
jgi:archaellum biogenesis ATPase FlaH